MIFAISSRIRCSASYMDASPISDPYSADNGRGLKLTVIPAAHNPGDGHPSPEPVIQSTGSRDIDLLSGHGLLTVCLSERRCFHGFKVIGRIKPIVFDDVADGVDFGMLAANADRLALQFLPLLHAGYLHAAPNKMTGVVSLVVRMPIIFWQIEGIAAE